MKCNVGNEGRSSCGFRFLLIESIRPVSRFFGVTSLGWLAGVVVFLSLFTSLKTGVWAQELSQKQSSVLQDGQDDKAISQQEIDWNSLIEFRYRHLLDLTDKQERLVRELNRKELLNERRISRAYNDFELMRKMTREQKWAYYDRLEEDQTKTRLAIRNEVARVLTEPQKRMVQDIHYKLRYDNHGMESLIHDPRFLKRIGLTGKELERVADDLKAVAQKKKKEVEKLRFKYDMKMLSEQPPVAKRRMKRWMSIEIFPLENYPLLKEKFRKKK